MGWPCRDGQSHFGFPRFEVVMNDILFYGGIVVTIFLTIAYFIILFLFPEWVGISGKDSEATLEAQREEKTDEKKED